MRLVLVRHGAADDARGRCVGHRDLALSAGGADDVRALAAAWHADARSAAPAGVFASDLRRAADSARLVAAPWRLDVATDPRLREMDFGEWDGEPWDALAARDGVRLGAWMEDWVRVRAPGGESFADVAARVAGWVDDLRAAGRADETVVAVAHAGAIRAALCHLLDWPLARAFQLRVDHARATGLALAAGAVELRYLNAHRVPPDA